jgi:DHA2 family methylenomycin A resistance protein-like MFS transporter
MTLIVTCLGSFMILLDASIVTLALPAIQATLHASLADLQWTIDAYTLPFAVLMLGAGTLGDRFGRKRIFLFGLILFLLGSVLCGLTSTLSWLLFGRVVQGVGAAALSTSSLSVLAVAFPDPRGRAQAIGLWSSVSGVALAAGPLLGGLLVQLGNWPAIFFVNVPPGLLALFLAWPFLLESRNPQARRIDLPGQLLAIGGLTCLVMGIIQGGSLGWTSPLILGLFLGAGVLLAAFLAVEMQAREPLLPLSLFGNRVFAIANVVTMTISFASFGPIFFLAQYFQQIQGYSVLQAGLRTIPISMGTFLTAPLAGKLAGRIGSRLPMIVGTLILGLGIVLLVNLAPATDYASLWWKLAMVGIGFGLTVTPVTAAIFSATPIQRAGLGASMSNTSNRVGMTLSVAVLGAFVTQQFAGNIITQLGQHGVPATLGTRIAQVARSGAQASHTALVGHLSLSPLLLHQILNQAFVDALHSAFLLCGICLFAAMLLVALAFKQPQPATQAVVPVVAPEVILEEVQ